MEAGERRLETPDAAEAARGREHGDAAPAFGVVNQAGDVGGLRAADRAAAPLGRDEARVAQGGVEALDAAALSHERQELKEIRGAGRVLGIPVAWADSGQAGPGRANVSRPSWNTSQ